VPPRRIIDIAAEGVRDVVRIARPHLVDVPRWAPSGDSLVVGIDQMDDSGNETGAAIGIVPATGGDEPGSWLTGRKTVLAYR
jgi:hypothetical protein